MFPFFKLHKTYDVIQSRNEVFTLLNKIISEPPKFYFPLSGNFITVDPPQFEFFMPDNFRPLGKPFKTLLTATLLENPEGTKIILQTKTNPAFWICIIVTLLSFLFHTFTKSAVPDFPGLLGYFLIISLMSLVDWFSKREIIFRLEQYLFAK